MLIQVYGKFKCPVSMISPEKMELPATLPLEDHNKRPTGSLTLHFWVSKWTRTRSEETLSNPRLAELGASSHSVRTSPRRGSGSNVPRSARSSAGSLNDAAGGPRGPRHDDSAGSGAEGDLEGGKFRLKAIKRSRSFSKKSNSGPVVMTNAQQLPDSNSLAASLSDLDLPTEPTGMAITRDEYVQIVLLLEAAEGEGGGDVWGKVGEMGRAEHVRLVQRDCGYLCGCVGRSASAVRR